jgi:hypothetical protein
LINRSLHEDVSYKIIQATEIELNSGDENCADTYYYLSKFLNWFGFLTAGILVRDRSLLICQMRTLCSRSSERHVELTCGAQIERGDLDKAEKVFRMHTQKFRVGRLPHFQFHLNLLRSEKTQFVKSDIEEFHEAEVRMFEIMEGKSVALIGTGTALGDYGEEIDSYDFVVRVKYPGREYMPPKSQHGERCDIAYFTSLTPLKMLFDNGEEFDALDRLKFLLIAQNTKQHKFREIPILFLSNLRSVFPNGDLTSGLLCLANLLRFQPSSVKLFGFDFYSTAKLYNSKMIQFYRREGWKIGDPTLMSGDDSNSFTERVQGHFWHDQIANFSFARNLFKAGIIKSEPVSAKILELTPQEYASRIERLLRASFLRSS